MASPFSGAWRELSDTHDSYTLFTETHFCHLRLEKGRKAISGQPSDEDAAALFRTMVAVAGTHAITSAGNAWLRVRTALLNARPEGVGRETRRTLTLDGEHAHEQFVRPDGTTGEADAVKVSEAGASPFAGVWELVSDAYEGLMLRTDAHYCALVTRRNRPLPQGSDLSVAEAAVLYRAAQTAVAGTYSIDGLKTTTRTLLDRNPALVGRESTRVWRFEDDRAIGVPEGGGEAVTWRKIG